MKSIKKLFAMGLALMMALSIPFSVSAAELEDAPIDESRTGSLTIYKYDLTNGATRSYLKRLWTNNSSIIYVLFLGELVIRKV